MPSEADEVGSRRARGRGPSSRLVNLRVAHKYRLRVIMRKLIWAKLAGLDGFLLCRATFSIQSKGQYEVQFYKCTICIEMKYVHVRVICSGDLNIVVNAREGGRRAVTAAEMSG